MLAPFAYFFVSSPASLARSAPVIRAPFLTVSATDPPRRCWCPTMVGPPRHVGQSKAPFALRHRHDAALGHAGGPRRRGLRRATPTTPDDNGCVPPEYVV